MVKRSFPCIIKKFLLFFLIFSVLMEFGMPTKIAFASENSGMEIIAGHQAYLVDFNSGSISNGTYNDGTTNTWKFSGDTGNVTLQNGQLKLGPTSASTIGVFDYGFATNPDTKFKNFEVSYDVTVAGWPSGGNMGFQFQKKGWTDGWGAQNKINTDSAATMAFLNLTSRLTNKNAISSYGGPGIVASQFPWTTYRVRVVVNGTTVKAFINNSTNPIVEYTGLDSLTGYADTGFIGLYTNANITAWYDNFLVNELLDQDKREDFSLTAGSNSISVQIPEKPAKITGYNIHYTNFTDSVAEQVYQYRGNGNETVSISVLGDKVYNVQLFPVYKSERTNVDTELTIYKEKNIVIGNPPVTLSATVPFEFATQTAQVKLGVVGANSIRYTLDGSEPSVTNGVEITGQAIFEGAITIDKTTMLKAATFANGVKTASLEKTYIAKPNPVMIEEQYSYHEGFFHENEEIRIRSDFADSIVYTTNGSDPVYNPQSDSAANGIKVNSNNFTATISNGSSHVKALAIRSKNAGPISSRVYTYLSSSIQAAFYVDPVNGSDTASGTESAPFKSIAVARDAVRAINSSMTGDIIVYLRGGTYQLDNTVTFDQRDSGNHSFSIIYKAYPGEKPVISGGKSITGWTLADSAKNIYKAPSQGINTRQLYVNGVRATRARSEKGLVNATTNAVGHTTTMTEMAQWRNIDDIEMVYKERWTTPRFSVDSIQVSGGIATIVMDQPGWSNGLAKGSTAPTTPWYIENAYELLDQPGEWYLDKTEGYFYYIPLEGQNMSGVTAVAPVLTELMTVKGGSIDIPVHDILFEGLEFSYSTWLRPSTEMGHPDVQANYVREPALPGNTYLNEFTIDAAVVVTSGKSVNFERCTFSKLGATGLNLLDGSQDNIIRGSQFYDISGTGIQIGEVNMNNINNRNPSDPKYLLKNIRIENNYIHHVAVEYMAGVGVSAAYPDSMKIVHNEIADLPYSAVHIGWGWENFPSNATKNNVIEYNYVHDVMNTLHDGGALYVVGRSSGPNGVSYTRYNFIEGVRNFHGALYFDQGSSDWRGSENVAKDIQKLGITNGSTPNVMVDGNITDSLGAWIPAAAITNTVFVTDGLWPQAAQNIMAAAGIESSYHDILPAVRPSRVKIPEEYLMKDDFEEYVVGGSLPEWNKVQTGGSVTVVGENGNQYMELKSLGTGGSIVSYNHFKDSYGRLTFEYKIKATSTGGFRLAPYLQSANADNVITLGMMNGNFVNNKGAAGVAIIQPYLANQWYDIKIVADTLTYKFDLYIDGVQRLTQESFRTAKSEIDQIRFGNEATVAGELCIDDIKVYRGIRGNTTLGVRHETTGDNLRLTISAPLPAYAAHMKLDIGDGIYDVQSVTLTDGWEALGAEKPKYSLDEDGLLDIVINLPREGTLVNGSMDLVNVLLTPKEGVMVPPEIKVLGGSAVYRMNGDIFNLANDVIYPIN